jgi:hypothetical protein
VVVKRSRGHTFGVLGNPKSLGSENKNGLIVSCTSRGGQDRYLVLTSYGIDEYSSPSVRDFNEVFSQFVTV